MFLCTDRLVEGLLKKEGKRKAAILMYQKIKKSEDNSNKIKCKDNGVFDSLCVVTSAGIDDKLFMATAINSIDTKQQGVTEIYHKEKNITSSNVSLAKEVPEMKSEGNGVVGGARDFMSKRFHPKPNRTNDVDAPTFTLGDKKKYKQVNKDSMFEMCNEVVRHPASLEEQDTDRPIVNSGFPNHNENHVPPVNGSVIINENQQSIFASVDVDFAKRFRRSNNPSVRELKVIAFVLSDHNPPYTRTVVACDLCAQFLFCHRKWKS
jgi:hypothetical protein